MLLDDVFGEKYKTKRTSRFRALYFILERIFIKKNNGTQKHEHDGDFARRMGATGDSRDSATDPKPRRPLKGAMQMHALMHKAGLVTFAWATPMQRSATSDNKRRGAATATSDKGRLAAAGGDPVAVGRPSGGDRGQERGVETQQARCIIGRQAVPNFVSPYLRCACYKGSHVP